MNSDNLVVLAYGLSNALRLASYVPQLWRVARDRGGAQAISCLSWNLWTAANATTALYAGTQLHDLALTVVNAGNALCCIAVVLITLFKRAALRRPGAPAPSHPKEPLMHHDLDSRRADPPPSRGWSHAAMYATAVAAVGVLALALALDSARDQTAALPEPVRSAENAPASPPPEPALDAGVDWARVVRAPDAAPAAVAAYER
jgi:hypothetical protein